MAVSGVQAGSATEFVSPDRMGFNALTSEDFLKLLITQLQNQDPSEPVGNEELLGQLSTMRNLQANLELSEAMKAITSSQNLSTAANFIGKSVKGIGPDGSATTGKVNSAFLSDGTFYVRVGDTPVKLTDVTEVVAEA